MSLFLNRARAKGRHPICVCVAVLFTLALSGIALPASSRASADSLSPADSYGLARLSQVCAPEVLPPGYIGFSNTLRTFRRGLSAGSPYMEDLLIHDLSCFYGAHEAVELFLTLEERFWSWHEPGMLGTMHWAVSDSRIGAKVRVPGTFLGSESRLTDCALRMEWVLPVGSRSALSAPGDSIAVRYMTTDRIHYSACLIGGLDFEGFGAKHPLRIYFNLGYRDSRRWGESEFVFSESYPHVVARNGAPSRAVLGGFAFEVPSERYSIFAGLTREHALSAGGFAAFRELPFKLNAGVTFWGGLPVSVGCSYLLSSDDPRTAFDPETVLPQWEFSVSLFGAVRAVQPDQDKDTVPDSKDRCLAQPEDCDGFRDEDGCPDPDNDGDGIPDVTDACPDLAESINGLEDEDGCPEADGGEGAAQDSVELRSEAALMPGAARSETECPDALRIDEPDEDADGIPDRIDACPRISEDLDGCEDEDGCPDIDNDGDGIVDEMDESPNGVETENAVGDRGGREDVRRAVPGGEPTSEPPTPEGRKALQSK